MCFGLAKRISSGSAGGLAEAITGTPYFMAPELFDGVAASERSDVYAVGVSYYCLLTGRFPYVDRSLMNLAEKHANEPVPDPRVYCPDLPDGVIDLVNRCMAKNPKDRPADGQAVHEELRVVSRQLGRRRRTRTDGRRSALGGGDSGFSVEIPGSQAPLGACYACYQIV